MLYNILFNYIIMSKTKIENFTSECCSSYSFYNLRLPPAFARAGNIFSIIALRSIYKVYWSVK